MSWVAVGGAAIGIGSQAIGSMGGSAKARRNEIAPGLSKYTAARESGIAADRTKSALDEYLAQMGGLEGDARAASGDMRDTFARYAQGLNAGQSRLAGQAGRATGEVAGVYKNYGREAEGVMRQNYADQLRQIQAQQAISRARQGGVNSGQDMIAAGANALATRGLNSGLADVAMNRAELVGGALERGRSQELGVGRAGMALQQGLMGQDIGMRQNEFALPAAYRQQAANQAFNTRTGNTMLYDQRNLQLALGGGSRSPYAEGNPLSGVAGGLTNLGNFMFAANYPMGGGNGGGGGGPNPYEMQGSYTGMNGGTNRPR